MIAEKMLSSLQMGSLSSRNRYRHEIEVLQLSHKCCSIRYGVLQRLHLDQGRNVESAEMHELCQLCTAAATRRVIRRHINRRPNHNVRDVTSRCMNFCAVRTIIGHFSYFGLGKCFIKREDVAQKS